MQRTDSGSTVVVEKVASLLKCAICWDKLTNPKQLSCGHQYCKTCLDGLLEGDGGGGGFKADGSAVICCPRRCTRRTFITAEQTTNDLGSCYEFKGILDLGEFKTNGKDNGIGHPLAICQYTKDCLKDVAVYCCDIYMCESCGLTHEKCQGDHDGYTNVFFDKKEKALKVLCSEHWTICNDICSDNTFVCMYCLHRAHKHHVRDSIDNAADEIKELLSSELMEMERIGGMLNATRKSIEECEQRLDETLAERKVLCMLGYLQYIDKEKENIKGKFRDISDHYLLQVPSTEFCYNTFGKSDVELAIEKNSIVGKLQETDLANSFSRPINVSLSDDFGFRNSHPLGRLCSEFDEEVSFTEQSTGTFTESTRPLNKRETLPQDTLVMLSEKLAEFISEIEKAQHSGEALNIANFEGTTYNVANFDTTTDATSLGVKRDGKRPIAASGVTYRATPSKGKESILEGVDRTTNVGHDIMENVNTNRRYRIMETMNTLAIAGGEDWNNARQFILQNNVTGETQGAAQRDDAASDITALWNNDSNICAKYDSPSEVRGQATSDVTDVRGNDEGDVTGSDRNDITGSDTNDVTGSHKNDVTGSHRNDVGSDVRPSRVVSSVNLKTSGQRLVTLDVSSPDKCVIEQQSDISIHTVAKSTYSTNPRDKRDDDILLTQQNTLKECVKRLQEHRLNYIQELIENEENEKLSLLLMERPDIVKMTGECDYTPFLIAAQANNLEIMKLMLEHGEAADVTGNGNTALHACAVGDSTECLHWLLDNHVSLLNAKNVDEDTALHLAAYTGHLSCVELLLACGAVQSVDAFGMTPLQYAVQQDNEECERELQKHACDESLSSDQSQ